MKLFWAVYMDSKVKGQELKSSVKRSMSNIFAYLHIFFGYSNPMGFIPKFCIIGILCSVGTMRIDDSEKIGNGEVDATSRKAMQLIELIK